MALDRLARRAWLRLLLIALAVTAVAAVACAGAAARAYVPPHGGIFAGLTGGTSIQPYARMVGKHPPVFETFMTWNTATGWLAPRRSSFRSRLALHIGTSPGYGQPGVITPGQIAAGQSDRFLISLGSNLAHSGRIVYVRLMAEMNGYWNAYAPFDSSGAFRGAQNSARAYVQAWRRSVLILRGGPVGRIDARLRRLGLPPVNQPGRSHLAVLARPRLAFLWVPQDAGSPDIPANSPGAFWPGSAYVDWVGTDFYASYPNFSLLDSFYARFGGKPFVLSEWALYGQDAPSFVNQLFAWVRAHHRVRMLNYYQGFTAAARPSLSHYPRSRVALRRQLRSRRFLAYPPEFAHPPRRPKPPANPPQPPAPAPPPSPPPIGGPSGVCVPLLPCLPL